MILTLSHKLTECKKEFLSILFLFLFGIATNFAQTPAFPGAEGYGKYTSGARGGTVYEVINLNNSGPGSLRDAVSVSGRTVVFRVSGDIELLSQLVIKGNITIAGQTAPGDGICVRDYPTKIDGDNVIIRYMRFRLGDRYGLGSDAFNINDCEKVILDHCTMSWGGDECFSAYGNHDITIQYCIIGEGLNFRNHSMGGLWGGYTSYHHNLIHTNNTRHPKYAYTYDEDITDSRNNVVYNWGYNSAYTSPTGRVNLANNYYKAGPASGVRGRIVQAEPTKRMYVAGNYVNGYPETTVDNWLGVDPLNGGKPIKYDTPFVVPDPIPEQSAQDAYLEIVQHAGASFPKRDDADNRAIQNLVNGTGFILNRQSDAGGFPKLNSMPAPVDSDQDGMPDDYEINLGLNPNDASDRNGDLNGNGYTNLEDYINGIPSFIEEFPKPGFFKTQAVAANTVNLSWYDLNNDELGFILERSTDSTVFEVVDTLAPNTSNYADNSLTPLTSYYYRIRSYNDTTDSENARSEVSTTFAAGALPGKVTLVSPEHNSVDMPITGTKLEWESGDYTLAFNVYTGATPTNLTLVLDSTSETSTTTGSLNYGSELYWRVDAINSLGVTTGDVWKFTTLNAVPKQLIGYWPFDETDGNVVYDSTTNSNDGETQDLPTLARSDGEFRGAIDFSNSSETGRIEIPNQPELAFDNEPFSIAFWMKLESPLEESTYIFHKGAHNAESGTEKNGKWLGIEMRQGNIHFAVDDNSKKTECVTSASSFAKNEWVHVAFVRDVYKKKMWVYKNAILNVQTNDNTTGIACDLPLILGNSDFLNTPYYGELDELVICKHPLSVNEIDSLYRFNKIPTMEYVPSAINDPIVKLSNLHVYPNPFRDELRIEFENGVQNRIILEIYNSLGQLIQSTDRSVIPNSRNIIAWDVLPGKDSKLENGFYLLLIKNKDGVITGSSSLIKTE